MTIPTDLFQYQRQAQVARLLARTHNKLVEILDKELLPFDISSAQYSVMSALVSGRAHSAAQICQELSYNSGAMTRMLDRMESKNLLRRQRSLEDRRTILVELTPYGQQLYPQLLDLTSKMLKRFFARFEQQDPDGLSAYLRNTVID